MLSQREDIEKTCELFSDLKIGKPSVSDELEWTGKYSQTSHESRSLDSDDESDEDRNPLKILAVQCGVGTYKKQHKIEEPDESLIKPEDLMDIESSVNNGIEGSGQDGNAYVKRWCDKIEKPKEKKKEPFRPNRLAKVNSDGQSPNSLQVKKPVGPHWEVTAATPPQPIYGDVKFISLQESFQLQKEQAVKLKVSIIIYHLDVLTSRYSKQYRLQWSRGSVLAFNTQVCGFKPGRSRRIFRAKNSSARLPSEGK